MVTVKARMQATHETVWQHSTALLHSATTANTVQRTCAAWVQRTDHWSHFVIAMADPTLPWLVRQMQHAQS